jgi:transposase
MRLPDNLERKEILADVEGKEGCREIGREVTEELEYEPGRFYVNRYIRPKYVSADITTVLIASMPERPLPKAIAGPGQLAQIVIDKYVDHLPLHRQQQRFTRENTNIPYSTITHCGSNICQLLTPLYQTLLKQVLASDYLHADETPVKILDKDKKGETHHSISWIKIDYIIIISQLTHSSCRPHLQQLLRSGTLLICPGLCVSYGGPLSFTLVDLEIRLGKKPLPIVKLDCGFVILLVKYYPRIAFGRQRNQCLDIFI